jgi:hypothetical protein
MRFSRFFSKSSIFFSIELFPSREHIEQKKKNQSNMSFLWSVMIESALKIMIFAVCPNFPTYGPSYGLEFIQKLHRKKHFQFLPNFPIFRATFSIFLSPKILFGHFF